MKVTHSTLTNCLTTTNTRIFIHPDCRLLTCATNNSHNHTNSNSNNMLMIKLKDHKAARIHCNPVVHVLTNAYIILNQPTAKSKELTP